MPNLTAVLNDRIRLVARREFKANVAIMRRATVRYRRDIAFLKRQMRTMARHLALLERQARKAGSPAAAATVENARFSARGVKVHRAKIGFSARDYGRLVGVSGLTIYHWEGGQARPRKQQLAKLITVRGIGKREAQRRLDLLDK
jgi:DNA-binding transcriptional regulator YiaG